MDVDLLYVPNCPNVGLARRRILAASEEAGVVANVHEREVSDEAEAMALGMRGSPTVLVDGTDVSRSADTGPGSISCRLYHSESGVDGAPTVDELVAAFTR